MPPTSRGRSQSISMAALARRASEERRTKPAIDLDDSPPTSGCMTPNHPQSYFYSPIPDDPSLPPPLSLSDQVHVAYALDDIHLAKILLLKLKGIEVTSDSDPRIAAVQPEDFDECFLPNGPFMSEEDEEAIKEMQRVERERLRVEHEKHLQRQKEAEEERKRREWEVQCERIWESEKKRMREEKEFIEKKKEEERKRWEESEKRRLAKEAEVKQRRAQLAAAKAARAAFTSPKISYAQLGQQQPLLPEDDLLYNVITPTVRAKHSAPSTPSTPSSSSHCFPSSLKSTPPNNTSISFKDVLSSMRGPLFPTECQPQPQRRHSRDSCHSHSHSHSISVSVRHKRRDDELLSSLLADVKREDIRRANNDPGNAKGKQKDKQSDIPTVATTSLRSRPFKASRQNSTASVASSNGSEGCPACSSSTPSPTSASPSTSAKSWFSFGSSSSSSSSSSLSSTSTNITTPSSSPSPSALKSNSATSGQAATSSASNLRNWLRVRAVTNASASASTGASLSTSTPTCTCGNANASPQLLFKPSQLVPISISVDESPLRLHSGLMDDPSGTCAFITINAIDPDSTSIPRVTGKKKSRKSTSRESTASRKSTTSNTVNSVVSSLNRFVELAKGFQSAYLQATVFAQVNGYDVSGNGYGYGNGQGDGSECMEKMADREESERERMWREEARMYREFKETGEPKYQYGEKKVGGELERRKSKKRKLRPVGYRVTREDVIKVFFGVRGDGDGQVVGGGEDLKGQEEEKEKEKENNDERCTCDGENRAILTSAIGVDAFSARAEGQGEDVKRSGDRVCARCSKSLSTSGTTTKNRDSPKSSPTPNPIGDHTSDNYQWIPLQSFHRTLPSRPQLNRPKTKLPNPLPFPLVFKPEPATPLTTSPLRRLRMMQQAKENVHDGSESDGHGSNGQGQGRFARRSSSSPTRSSSSYSRTSFSTPTRTRNPIPRPRFVANPFYLRVRALNNCISSVEAQRMGLTGSNAYMGGNGGSGGGKLREKVVSLGFEDVGRSLLGLSMLSVGVYEDGDDSEVNNDTEKTKAEAEAETEVQVEVELPVQFKPVPHQVQRGRPAVPAIEAGYVRRGRCVVRG